jgi:hypothetical protein
MSSASASILLHLTRHETDLHRNDFTEYREIRIRLVFKRNSGSHLACRPRRLAGGGAALPSQSHFWTRSPHHGPAAERSRCGFGESFLKG